MPGGKAPKSRDDFLSLLDEWGERESFTRSVKRAIAPEFDRLSKEHEALKRAFEAQSKEVAILKASIDNAHERNGSTPYKTALTGSTPISQGGKPVTRGEVKQIIHESTTTRLSENHFKLRVSGLKDFTKANGKLKVIAMAKSIDVDLYPADFTADPIMVSQEGNEDKVSKGVMLKFATIWKKQELYKARIGLKGRDIFLSEQLDKKTQEVFYLCRKLKRENLIQNTWTFNSIVYIKISDRTIRVNDRSCYEQIVEDMYKEKETGSDVTPALSQHTQDISSPGQSQSDLNLAIRVTTDGPSATSSPIGKSGSKAPGVPEAEISRLLGLSVSDPDLTSYEPSDNSINKAEAILRSKEEKLYNLRHDVRIKNPNSFRR